MTTLFFLQTVPSANAFSIHWKEISLDRSLRLGVVLLIAVALHRVAKIIAGHYLKKQASGGSRTELRHQQQVRTVADLLLSAFTALIAAFGALTVLDIFGVNITPFAAAAGLMSLAVGFGGQYLVRDLINGAVIIFEDQYVVGDNVRIGDLGGQVEHVTLRRTVLRADSGALISIPNGLVDKVMNLSRDWAHLAVDVVIARDGNSVDRASTALKDVAKSLKDDEAWRSALVGGQPQLLGVESFTDKTTTLRLEGRTTPDRRDEIVREIRQRVRQRFAQEDIELESVQQSAS